MRIRQLDGLRGICAIMLVFFHFGFKDTTLTSIFIVRRADLFVDFFFVLSGFVISVTYIKDVCTVFTGKAILFFIKKRIARLYPLLLYTTLIHLVYSMLLKVFVEQKSPATQEVLFLKTLDTLTFLNSTPILGRTNGMNFPSWSISAEMISYFFFGMMMFMKKGLQIWIATIMILGAILFVLFKNQYLLTGDFGFVRGIYCFLIGHFTFLFYQSKKRKTNLLELPIVILVIVVLYWSNANYNTEPPLLLMPWIFGMVIYIFANSDGILTKVLNGKYFQRLGTISYSIYLNHALVLAVINLVFWGVFKFPKTELIIMINLFVALLATIIYSEITYRLVERRIGKKMREFLKLKAK